MAADRRPVHLKDGSSLGSPDVTDAVVGEVQSRGPLAANHACSVCRASYTDEQWPTLGLLERLGPAEVRRLLLGWPDALCIEVRTCDRCGGSIAAGDDLGGVRELLTDAVCGVGAEGQARELEVTLTASAITAAAFAGSPGCTPSFDTALMAMR